MNVRPYDAASVVDGPRQPTVITVDVSIWDQICESQMVLVDRIGFARGQIEEAMGYLDCRNGRAPCDRVYWAHKALTRALAILRGASIT